MYINYDYYYVHLHAYGGLVPLPLIIILYKKDPAIFHKMWNKPPNSFSQRDNMYM